MNRRGLEPGSAGSAPKVRLSCQMCQQRKMKCDKLSPCSQCQRHGFNCVPVERARLPRGRSQKAALQPSASGSDLEGRMARLERLLPQLASEGAADRSNTSPGVPVTDAGPLPNNECSSPRSGIRRDARNQHPEPTPRRNIPMGDAFSSTGNLDAWFPDASGGSLWVNSAHQTSNIHQSNDVTELAGDMATYDPLPTETTTSEFLCGSIATSIDPYTTPQLRRHLCHIFLANVGPVINILHRPSLYAFLLEGKPYLDYPPSHQTPEILKCSIYYAAACSVGEEHWSTVFGACRGSVIARYQWETEAALRRADYINTDDLTVLQAFVIYLVSTRSQDPSRRAWTMLSVALRIAQAISLHLPQFSERPFDQEMRRRLWHAIGMLDVQAALDRGTEPMMKASWLEFLPSNVNDNDLTLCSHEVVHDPEGFTDTSFTLIMSKAQCVVRALNFGGLMEPGVVNMHMRQACVVVFQETASRLLRNSQPDAEPFHWYTRQVAECIDASMQLIVVRPMHYSAEFTPPRIRGGGLLKLSVKALQKAQELYSDERGRPWRWFEGILVPRHALAVSIAELCVCDDSALMEQCWPVVESAFDRFNNVWNLQKGLLWKPIEEGLARARSKRDSLLGVPVRDPGIVSGTSLTSGPTHSRLDWQSLLASDFDPQLNIWDMADFGGPDVSGNIHDSSWSDYKNLLDSFKW